METPLKTIREMVWDEVFDQILDAWPTMSESRENILKKAISAAYTNGLKDGQK